MRKAIIVFIILTITMVSLLSACGGTKEVEDNKDKKDPNISSVVETNKTKDKKEGSIKVDLKGAKNNAEAFLEYAKKVAKDIDFMGMGDYADYMVYISRIYEDTITNPYSGHKDMAVSNRTSS
ncbi:MAG: hypothetical protein GX660_18835, partial [Clostridiaceae bacterium]|nr:hypothetical protein [Clostridiaceae bacterium]